MPFNIFKSKKRSSPKGKTIKKSEPIDGRQARRDFYKDDVDNNEHVVDHKNVEHWIKEGVSETSIEHAKNDGRHETAVLQPTIGPHRATLVDVVAAPVSSTGNLDIMPMSLPTKSEFTGGARKLSSNGGIPNEQPQPPLDLLIGQQNTSSPYFTRRYARLPDSVLPRSWQHFRFPIEDASGSSLIRRPDLDPEALKLYQIWLQTGTLIGVCREMKSNFSAMDDRYVWQYYWPLMNAHILGCTIGEPDFADLVMDIVKQVVTTCPDLDTINHIFSTAGEGLSNELKQLIVDEWLRAGGKRGEVNLGTSQFPQTFVSLALRTALELPGAGRHGRSTTCKYHTHKRLEACYRLRSTPEDLERQNTMEVLRETSQRDSYAAIIDATNAEMTRINREEQTLEASSAMQKDTGRIRVGFKRMGDDQTLPKGTASSFANHDELTTPVTGMFGTTQTNGAVDEIVSSPRRRTSAPPYATTESSVSTVVPLKHTEAPPAYQTDADGQVESVVPIAPRSDVGNNTPASSLWSRPDSELRQSWETAVEYGKRSACPGAFPESRDGSVRSVTP